MGQQKRNTAVILLRLVIVSIGVGGQTIALGAELDAPLDLLDGSKGFASAVDEQLLMRNAPSSLLVQPTLIPVFSQILVAQAAQLDTGEVPAVQDTGEAPAVQAIPQAEPSLDNANPDSTNATGTETTTQRDRTPRMAGVPETQQGSEAGDITANDLEPDSSAGSPVVAPAQPMPASEEFEPGPKYKIAPVRWQGTLSETVGWLRSSISQGGTSTVFQNVQTVGVSASSFIVQPWLATVKGHFGLVHGTSNLSNVSESDHTNTTKLNGGGDLSVLAQSRYPFTASFNISDSRVQQDGGIVSSSLNDYVNKQLSLTQYYTPPSGYSNFFAGYDRNITNYDLLGSDTASTLTGRYATKFGSAHDQPFTLEASRSVQRTYALIGARTTNNITATHLYMPPESLLTLRTVASAYSVSQPMFSSTDTMDSRYKQINTTGTWQPEAENIPLVVTGNAFAYSSDTEIGGVTTNTTRSVGTGVAATYKFSNPLTLVAGASVAKTNIEGNATASTSVLTTREYAIASYRPAAIKLGQYSYYNWYGEGGVDNQTSTPAATTAQPSNRTIYAEGNHSLSTPFTFKWSSLTTSLNQGLRVQTDQISGNNETLNHSADIQWRFGVSETLPSVTGRRADQDGAGTFDFEGRQQFTAETRERSPSVSSSRLSSGGGVGIFDRLGVNYQDTRVYGAYPAHYQAVRLTAGIAGAAAYSISGYGAQGDVSLSATRQANGPFTTDAEARISWAYGYAYKYRKGDVLGVRGLRYEMELRASMGLYAATGASTQYGSQYTLPGYLSRRYPFSAAWVQALVYRIGQNEALVSGSLANQYGIKSASLFFQFRAWRNFGN
ncbi:MAG: hypothetical protein V4443_04105 [Pseudomonadota bacterium]